MITKQCPKCESIKSLDEFHKKTNDYYHSYCKTCLYKLQKERWKDRKQKALELMGGKCNSCGYNKNYAALEFHHLDPKEKEFDFKKLRQCKWDTIINELKKCVMLCSNCHREAHHPEAFIKEVVANNCLQEKTIKSTGLCPQCKTETFGTKYCSTICSADAKRKVARPNREELAELLKSTSYFKIGQKYGVSDNAIRKWAKCYGIL
jgi:hypothetical protein